MFILPSHARSTVLTLCLAARLTLPDAAAEAETVILSEFLASNAGILQDGDGRFSDWIELHNFGTEAVDLTGWSLTDDADDPAKWRFPDTTLLPGAYLVVFASGRPEGSGPDGSGYLHASFQLSANGEHLALVGPDGSTVVSAFTPAFPVQHPDVSFGWNDARTAAGFFVTPTPGTANGDLLTLGLEVAISPPSNTFTETLEIALSAPLGSGQEIRYTTDGSPPVNSLFTKSPLYTGPILLTGNTRLRAAVFQGSLSGPVATATYLKLAGDIQDFSSNLPFLLIDSGQPIAPTGSPVLTPAQTLLFDVDPGSGRATITGDPQYAGRSGLRIRGRSSASFPKKQYKFETWDQDDQEENANLLGLGGESDWVLSAPYTDKSLMRNLLTFRLWAETGRPSIDGRFVELFLNSDSDRQFSYADDYLGVYVLVESITLDDDRIDFDPPEDTDLPGMITGGYIMEMGNADSQQFTTNGSGRSVAYRHKDPNLPDLNTAQRGWIRTFILDFEKALYGPNFRHPDTGRPYADYTDTASQVDYKIFREWTRNFDGGSTFFYVPRGGKLTMGPLWDYNWALGNVNYAEGGDLPGYRTDGWNRSFTANVNGWSPWWLRFEQDPEWQQQLTDRWRALRQGPLSSARVHALIEEMATLLEQEAAGRNFQKWPVLGQFTVISPPGYQNRTTYRSEVAYLEDWIRERMAWIDSQFLEPPNVFAVPGDNGLEVTLSSPDGAVYYTTDGSDPRAPGGAPEPSATQFAGGRIDVILVPETSASRFLVPTGASLGDSWLDPLFDDAGWMPGSGGLGFETPGGPLLPAITTDVSEPMLGVNASLYVRYTFDYDNDPTLLHRLILRLRYDDAFVAWINGSEAARDAERSPAQIAWDSFATGSRPDSEAVQFAEFDLTQQAGLLRRGRNVLAIQIMNTSAGSSDLLLHPVLQASHTVTAQPLLVEQSTLLIARTRSGDSWSAPSSAYLAIGEDAPSAANLLITEIMYHPADPSPEERAAGFNDAELFEFLELHNPGPRPVTLEGVRLSDGVLFDFLQSPTPSIPPGGYVVVVSDPTAFAARYGTGRPIAGSYEGNLRNSGETLIVEADGGPLITIAFSDTWFAATDGDGYSLVLNEDGAPPADWSAAAAWRQSGLRHGSPGWAETSGGYRTWLEQHFSPTELDDPALAGSAADPDGDGAPNLVEYALGLDPRTTDPAGLPRLRLSTEDSQPVAELQFERPIDRPGIRFYLETSADLRAWAIDAGAVFHVSPAGDGFERVRVRPAQEPQENGMFFLRLRVAEG